MRRFPTTLLAAATVLLPVLSMAAHGDDGLGSSGYNGQEVVVTGHAQPEPALHIEALSGIVDLYCLGCLLDHRQPAQAADPRAASRPQTRGRRALTEVIARWPLELPAYRSPRAPPAA